MLARMGVRWGRGGRAGPETRAGAAPRARWALVKADFLGSAGPTSADIGSTEMPSWARHAGLVSRSEPHNPYGDTTRHVSRCMAISTLPEWLLPLTQLCEGS